MADICSITRAEKIVRTFVTTVEIPVGFAIDVNWPENDDVPISQEDTAYNVFLSMDKSAVEFSIVEELFDSVITVPGFTADTPTMDMFCQSRMRVFKFNGPLFYNCIISGFVPVAELTGEFEQDDGTGHMTETTAFSGADTILIDDAVGYACPECVLPDNLRDDFDIEITQREEFVIDNDGSKIPHVPENPNAFFRALQGQNTQIIHVPYTITLTPKPSSN